MGIIIVLLTNVLNYTKMITADITEYTIVLLKKGPKHNIADDEFIQQNHQAHTTYQASLKANGVLIFSGTTPAHNHIAGINIYNIADAGEVKSLAANDPGVTAGLFDYEIIPCFSLPVNVNE